MRVCFVLEHFYPHIGGGETLFKTYSARLVEAGCEVKVVTSNSGGLNGKIIREGVEVHYCNWKSYHGHPVPRRRDLYPFVEWCDIVHGATYTAAPKALAAARKFQKPCVVTAYEVLGNKWFWVEQNVVKATLFYLFERFVVKKGYSLYHAISQATRNDLLKCGIAEDKIVTIYPGVEPPAIKRPTGSRPNGAPGNGLPGSTPAPRKILYYGRPGKTKGVFVFLEAIKKAQARLPKDARFTFVLSREPERERKRFLNLVKENNLHHLLEVRDPLIESELLHLIQNSFCVVVPSMTEGFGYTAAETCHLDKPIIASDGGSLPEIVSGKTLFFQNRNADDLAEKILQALENKFTTIPKKVFAWDESTKQLLQAYEKLLAGLSSIGQPQVNH